MVIEAGKTYRIKGNSKYFQFKYGTPNPEFIAEGQVDYRRQFAPPTFLYQGRALAEGLPATDGYTVYGHIDGLGEFVHESELEEICEHNWVSAVNEVVKSGEICTKCYAVRA